MTTPRYEVGQRVWIYDVNGKRMFGANPIEGKVTKIGRTLVTVERFGQADQFRIADGIWNNRQFGHNRRLRTDEEKAATERHVAVNEALVEAGVQFKFGAPAYSIEQLEAVLAVLKP